MLLLIKDIWDGIRTQVGRAALSFMSISIGVSALIVLIAILGGLQERSRQIVKELGVNVVGILQKGVSDKNTDSTLKERHASLLALNLPDCSVSTIRRYSVPTLGTQELLTVVGTDSSLINIRQWQMYDGRFLDYLDIEGRERNAVISKSLSSLWSWKVGNLIMLRNIPFKIVGIVEAGGSALDTELSESGLMLGDRVLFVPKTVPPYWEIDQKNPSPAIDAIFLRVPASMNFTHTVAAARRLLLHSDYPVSNISWVTPESLIQGIKKLQNTIRLTVGSIAVLCLILGGTTLMSLMIANVRDRVTEIGLRRAMGASRWSIAILFVLEACLITGIAAIATTLVTHLILIMGRNTLPVPLKLGHDSIMIPLIAALILGIIFSYLPAKSAANITPSEALRNE